MLIAIVSTMTACSTKKNDPITSNVAQLNTFSFAAQDNYPGFAEAKFKVVQGTDTGFVYSIDSIRFGTPLNRAVPKYTFEATPGSAKLQLGDTVIMLSGADTLDFTKRPIYLTIISSDLSTTKVYSIQPLVHQVDPDLYQWETLTTSIYPKDDSEQQLVMLGDEFYLFANNGYTTSLYHSLDGRSWEKRTLEGLPSTCHVRGIVSDGEALYYAQDATLYTSLDAETWAADDYSTATFTIQTMLMHYNDTIWAVVENKEDQQLYLGKVNVDILEQTEYQLDANFPISDFCAVEFAGTSERLRAMIIGGYAKNGQCLNSRWNIEYAETSTKPYRFINYSIEQPSFTTLTGVSVVWYNNQLLMVGGVDADMQFRGNEILVSIDEGFTWQQADTTKCQLPASYTARQKQTMIVHDDNIYIVGGQDMSTTYSDVYRGRLNSIDWDKITN